MTYLKVSNIHNGTGYINYKGLDIKLFIAGSQVYPVVTNACLVATKEDLTNFTHVDVDILTEQQYLTLKEQYLAEKDPEETSLSERITTLENLALESEGVI